MSGPVARPGFHLTPPAGWINDPLGVTWHGRYELFVQYNPAAPEWAPACRWGQLRSPDLVRWSWVGTALEPAEGEGCWSGSVVVDGGLPVIVYTSVRLGALDTGRIALARGDRTWRGWTPDPAGPVLAGPPPEPAMTHFRDPFVRPAEGGGWRMVVGGGTADGRAVALQYSSSDLRSWRYDGVLAERAAGDREPMATGSVWECVQLFPAGDAWVLLVSVWEAGSPQRVAYAVGDYDGRRFSARNWHRFTATDTVYATTCFADAAGRRCALSWIREPGPQGAVWAGALTLPVVLAAHGERLALRPHPDVNTLRTGRLAGASVPAGGTVALGPWAGGLDVGVRAAHLPGGEVAVTLADDDGALLTVRIGAAGATAARPGRPDAHLEAVVPADAGDARVLIDAGIAEVFAGGDCGVLRLRPAAGPVRLRVSASGGAHVPAVAVHGMPAAGS